MRTGVSVALSLLLALAWGCAPMDGEAPRGPGGQVSPDGGEPTGSAQQALAPDCGGVCFAAYNECWRRCLAQGYDCDSTSCETDYEACLGICFVRGGQCGPFGCL
jgi:hypothetical protein